MYEQVFLRRKGIVQAKNNFTFAKERERGFAWQLCFGRWVGATGRWLADRAHACLCTARHGGHDKTGLERATAPTHCACDQVDKQFICIL